MKYILMQKNYPVVEISIDSVNGQIIGVGEVFDSERLPLSISDSSGNADRYKLEEWWKSRSIPLSRQGLQKALREMDIKSPDELVTKCLGLSLSDQYWIKPEDKEISWESVNFFDNDFSEDIGNILFGGRPSSDKLHMFSPDNAANGWLKKKWKIINGTRCLVKAGDGFQQQPFNEVIATQIAEHIGINHTIYSLGYTDKYLPVCICDNFINRDTELIPASFVNMTLPRTDKVSKYNHFCQACKYLHIPDFERSLDEIIILDYIMANQDRHYGNFGVIRDVDSLKFLGFSPIYDSGTSLRYDTPDEYIDVLLDVESQPFESFHNEQIRLVTDFSRFNLDNLNDIRDIVKEAFSDKRYTNFMKENRPDILTKVLISRIETLEKIIEKELKRRSGSSFPDPRFD